MIRRPSFAKRVTRRLLLALPDRSRLWARRVAQANGLRAAVRRKDRIGGRPYVLQLANLYANATGERGVAMFAEAVARGSAGTVRLRFVNSWTADSDRHEEKSLIRDVARGRADLGWAGARVFGTLGVRSLDPLQAPFLIGSYEQQLGLYSSDLLYEMLDYLEQLDLIGLAILPGALRKPFGLQRAFRTPSDFAGAVIRTHESTVGEATFRALGATPVALAAKELRNRPLVGIDGMDLNASAVAGWGYTGHLTWNANLWPRMIAIVANRRAFARLGNDLQQLLREAATDSAFALAAELTDQGRADLAAVPQGLHLAECTEHELLDLRRTVEPVHEALRRNPATRDLMSRLETTVGRAAPAEPRKTT